MQFATQAQKDCYEKVNRWITDMFGEITAADTDRPMFVIPYRSAMVSVTVNPWSDHAVINTKAFVVTGGNITPELMRYLLCINASMRFGAFGIDTEGEIIFEHNIVGSTCDREELTASIVQVMQVADSYDDKIVEFCGGRRAIDLVTEMKQSAQSEK